MRARKNSQHLGFLKKAIVARNIFVMSHSIQFFLLLRHVPNSQKKLQLIASVLHFGSQLNVWFRCEPFTETAGFEIKCKRVVLRYGFMCVMVFSKKKHRRHFCFAKIALSRHIQTYGLQYAVCAIANNIHSLRPVNKDPYSRFQLRRHCLTPLAY